MSTVSKGIRTITTSTPLLWTHVDLALTQSYKNVYTRHAQNCFKYSRHQSLYVHVFIEAEPNSIDAKRVIKVLRPHMSRIVSITLRAPGSLTRDLVRELFDNPDVSHLRDICLSNFSTKGPYKLLDSQIFDDCSDECLRSLQTLMVRGPLVSLDSYMFQGLTVLKLMPSVRPVARQTIHQLTGALMACPGLRVLSLLNFGFDALSGISAGPVDLPQLEQLDLRFIRTAELPDLLSSMSFSSRRLAFSMSVDHEELPDDQLLALQTFINRVNVTRLLLEGPLEEIGEDWPDLLMGTKFPAIEELALSDFAFARSSVGALPCMDPSSFPAIHTLHILNCITKPNCCRQYFGSSLIQSVYVDDPENMKAFTGLIPSVQRREYPYICDGEGDFAWPVNAHF
ncbi:hypothetical protein RhiJN_19652 [Ceratobasidium sp. AG-Ba]|nr:hypothetical protein RhiJN_19652 [Ceratobasidium sp. AG-Ba]QRW05701.1 hypothetical protein RhiLY_04700 [Ceratobasidium sp. AG-Ba]